MKKKTIANIGMVFAIIAIVLSGIFVVGHIKGWFDKQDDRVALLTNYRGIITIEREGVAYTAKEDTVLRDGDKIICDTGSTVRVVLGEAYVVLGQSAQVEIKKATVDDFSMEVKTGETFVNTEESLTLSFDEKMICLEETVASLSVRSGAQSISVFYGSVEEAQAGQMLEWIGDAVSLRTCAIQSLNDFHIAELKIANETKELFFSKAELEKLEADRWEAIVGVDSSETEEVSESEETEMDSGISTEVVEPSEDSELPSESDDSEENVNSSVDDKPTNDETVIGDDIPSNDESPSVDEKPSDSQNPPVNSEIPSETETRPEASKLTCTITIRCDTILNNWDNLDPAKAAYVPSNGCILPIVTVEFTEGETVFDVLKRVCDKYGIAIEYSWTPMYDNYYIEGIHNLYEFDCGFESGWMYKVNEWFPNYGCSSYVLAGGENIVWCYTCVGLGADVGAEGW